MTRPIVSSTALFALLLAGSSPAQPAADGRPPKPLVDLALDTDGDEVLSAAEIANAPAALKKLDTNGDGQLTMDELRPKRPDDGGPAGGPKAPDRSGPPPEAGRPKRPLPPIVAALDADGDGVISAAEIANAAAALRKLDRNRDGKLTPDEYRPPRPDDGVAAPGDKGAARKPQ
ncbi:MAG: hypothetical protein U0529_19380 [Thermoanaerobaculia bacterium]